MTDAALKLFWQSSFYQLLAGCIYFITYKWNIFGWHLSILNGIIFVESFELVMDFIGRMFGKEEVQNE